MVRAVVVDGVTFVHGHTGVRVCAVLIDSLSPIDSQKHPSQAYNNPSSVAVAL
jgi:hypothetical protein